MKKTFVLSHPKISYQRLIETAKGDVKNTLKKSVLKPYLKMRIFGALTVSLVKKRTSARVIHEGDINTNISSAQSQHWKSFYLEVVSTAKTRTKRRDVDFEEGPEED